MKKKQGAFPNEWFMLIHFFLLMSILATNIALCFTSNYSKKTTTGSQLPQYRTKIAETVTNDFTVCFMLLLIFKFTLTKKPQKKVASKDNQPVSRRMSTVSNGNK